MLHTTHTHTHTRTHARTHARTYAHAHTHTHTYTAAARPDVNELDWWRRGGAWARRTEKERELRQQSQFYYHIKRGLEWDTLPALCPQYCTCRAGVIVRGPSSPPPPPLSRGLLLFSLAPFLFVIPHSPRLFCHCVNTAERELLTCRPQSLLPEVCSSRTHTHTHVGLRLCLHFWEFVWVCLSLCVWVFLHLNVWVNVSVSHCLNICRLFNADEFAQCCLFVCSGGKCGSFNNAAHCWLNRLYGAAYTHLPIAFILGCVF